MKTHLRLGLDPAKVYLDYRRFIRATAHSCGFQQCDLDDIEQDVALKICEKLSTLRNPKALSGWIKIVTLNHCYGLTLRRKREKTALAAFGRQQWICADAHDTEEMLAKVPQIVGAVHNDVQKKVAFLWYIRGCKTREIASELKIPSSTVSSHVHRFRAFARTELLQANG